MVSSEKKRKDYTFWCQFNEKPRILQGCPGVVSLHLQQQHEAPCIAVKAYTRILHISLPVRKAMQTVLPME